jgi:glycosyltransferase involved in cell wall biosynthesis
MRTDVRVLYSFPHKIGSGRIADTAWHQVAGASAAGADIDLITAVVHTPLPEPVRVRTTLARGRWRIPYRVIGKLNAFTLHDRLVARRLENTAGQIDVVHTWPLGALETLRTARRLGIPTVLERPNTHTRYAYTVVRDECVRLGVDLPADHEHAFNAAILEKEEAEYRLADRLLCPSDFVLKTFVDEGYPESQLVRHFYGYDDATFFASGHRPQRDGLVALFVGVAAVRKGLHFALEAWLRSPASARGRFLVAGEMLPDYEARLQPLLTHPSVEVLGHRNDVPELMRTSDVLLLPSIEEGSALAASEAAASGCVPLVSSVTSGNTIDGVNALVHEPGDVGTLTRHVTMVDESPELLTRLREGAIRTSAGFSWPRAGERLFEIYAELADSTCARTTVTAESLSLAT